jgi:hypothetical protein
MFNFRINVGKDKMLKIIIRLFLIILYRTRARSWDSSVNIMTDHGLEDRGSIPDRGKGFFL